MRDMALNPEPCDAERTSRVPIFTGEVDFPVCAQASPKILVLILFRLEPLINGAAAVQQLKDLRKSFGTQVSPLLAGTSRTPAVGRNRVFRLQLEIGNSGPPGE